MTNLNLLWVIILAGNALLIIAVALALCFYFVRGAWHTYREFRPKADPNAVADLIAMRAREDEPRDTNREWLNIRTER